MYLPKRSGYQGRLYETLTSGFDWTYVRNHFTADLKPRAEIDDLLKQYTEYYDPLGVDTIDQFFWGYSMYVVDGVYFLRDGDTDGSTRNGPR